MGVIASPEGSGRSTCPDYFGNLAEHLSSRSHPSTIYGEGTRREVKIKHICSPPLHIGAGLKFGLGIDFDFVFSIKKK
jgi:hypothetical protein